MERQAIRAAIGESVGRAREAAGWSQAKLANRIGISEFTLKGYEQGLRSIPAEFILTISIVLAVPLERLLGEYSMVLVPVKPAPTSAP